MKMNKIICAGASALIFVAGAPSVAFAKKAPQLTPLELQALQSKEFETSKSNLFGAVMTVVQDLGYQVQSADLQTGFITAISATEQKTNFFEALGGANSTANTKMTAFIQDLPNGMARVRLNFLFSKTTSSVYGQANQRDKPLLDVVMYRSAWDKIDEALFVMGALEPSPTKAPLAVPLAPSQN
jgi:hypothetical protein